MDKEVLEAEWEEVDVSDFKEDIEAVEPIQTEVKRSMSNETKMFLFKKVISMPGGYAKIAETIQQSPNPEATLQACHVIIDMIEDDAKKEVTRAHVALDKADAKLIKMELKKEIANLKM